MSSAVLAPVAAAQVLPLCHRSWRSSPVWRRALSHADCRTYGRSGPPPLAGEQQAVGRCGHVACQVALERGDVHVWNGDRTPARCRLRIAYEELTRSQAHHRPPDGDRAVEQVDTIPTRGEDLASAQRALRRQQHRCAEPGHDGIGQDLPLEHGDVRPFG